jgi:hypothetical protein
VFKQREPACAQAWACADGIMDAMVALSIILHRCSRNRLLWRADVRLPSFTDVPFPDGSAANMNLSKHVDCIYRVNSNHMAEPAW